MSEKGTYSEVVMEERVTLAIIGGSGLYTMPGLESPREHDHANMILILPLASLVRRLPLGH